MDFTANTRMLFLPVEINEEPDEIPDYNEKLDLTLDSNDEEQPDSALQEPQKSHETTDEKINWQEQIHMIHLRSHLNKLLETVKHAQYVTDKTREEFKKCCNQIEQLEDERNKLCQEIKTNENEGNKAAIARLQAALQRVCKELDEEQKLETVVRDRLEQAEYELALAEVDRGKFILAEDDLIQKEQKLDQEKTRMVLVRLQKEEFLARQIVTSKKKNEIKLQNTLNNFDMRHMKAVEEAEKSHERANKYLSKTLAKLKQRQQEEHERYNTDMARKMDMLLKLKRDITNNRENLRAISARDKAAERQKKHAEQEEVNRILAEGGNAEEMLLIKKRRNEVEKKKQHFEAEQKLKKAEIVQKILREEENLKKRMQHKSYLWSDPEQEKDLTLSPVIKKPPRALLDYIAATSGEEDKVEKVFIQTQEPKEDDSQSSDSYLASESYHKILENLSIEMQLQATLKHLDNVVYLKDANSSKNINKNQDDEEMEDVPDSSVKEEFVLPEEEVNYDLEEADEEEEEEEYEDVIEEPLPDKVKDLDVVDYEEDEEMQENLAVPEFEGLWSKKATTRKSQHEVDKVHVKPVGKSKMEKEILKKTLEKTREGIITTQVAAGKVFKGISFYSKPSVIHFKDFVVGISYKKKVTITNVSYTVNYIRFIDITETLKDFIQIHFEPPGAMSAGMKCEMTVTFQPVVNIEQKGNVYFLTQTGPFQIPLICSTKKCELSLDTSIVDFGTSVIGETLKRSFVLTNRGALGTSFKFVNFAQMKPEISTTEAHLSYAISRALTSVESKETVIDDAVSIIQIQDNHLSELQTVIDDQDFSTEEFNAIEGVISEIRNEIASEIMLESMLEDAEIKITADNSKHTEIPADEVASVPARSSVHTRRVSIFPDVVPVASLSVVEETANEITDIETILVKDIEEAVSPPSSTTPCIMTSDEESMLDGMRVGPLFAGEIGPFSSVRLEIIWHPTIPGEVNTKFIVSFGDPEIKPLFVHAVANAIDVPVWLERHTVDLKICIFDRLYQDTLVINNRATTAQKLQFDVCKELQNHLELLPKNAYIQAHSQFSAQLKFLPRYSLFKEALKFFDPNTGVLEAPLTLRVAGQMSPVCFTVQAVVTSSDLEFSICELDFGCCTVHESVKHTIKVTNKSILSQQYGFVGLPNYLEVQPNDGFGTLLPLETLELDVIFSPKSAKVYEMNLLCRTLINREFCIPCKGIGVLPPLELSKQVIHFRATPLYDTCSAALYVINNHTSTNEYTHPVPRIGRGDIFPVGPTSFEFKIPDGTPITISPTVGTVPAGQKLRVQVRFSPTLSDNDIRMEAVRIQAMLEEEKEERAREEAERKLKEEQEQQEAVVVIEQPKPKKGAKRGDANISNQMFELPREIKMDIFTPDDYNTSGHAENEEKVEHYNESESRHTEIYNTAEISDITCHKIMNVPDSTFLGTPKICTAKTESNKCTKEKVKPFVNKYSANFSNVTKGITDGRISFSSQPKNINKDDIKSRKLSRSTAEVRRPAMQGSIPLEHYQNRLPSDRNKLYDKRKVNVQRQEMNINNSTKLDKDTNNNMDVEENESVETRSSMLNRQNETPVDSQSGSKSAVNDFSDPLLVAMSSEAEDKFSDELSHGSKRKLMSTSKISILKSKSKITTDPQSTMSSIREESISQKDDAEISMDSDEYRAAIAALIRQFKGHFQSFSIPCYVAFGQAGNPGELKYSIHNTLYLEIHCPTVKPPIVVISDGGRRTVDFGSASIGQTCSKCVTVQNISDKDLKLSATALNPTGPFQVRNALRSLSPGATHTILLTFIPDREHTFQENFELKALNSTLHLTLIGYGVNPLVKLSIEKGIFDMGAVLVGEFIEKPFLIENLSSLAITYSIEQDSLSHSWHTKAQNIPPYLGEDEPHKTRNYVGVQNKSGRSVFDIVPATGTIEAGDTMEIMVTFAPDHESDLYSDGVRIVLFSQKEKSHFFQLIGQAKNQVMYLEGCDPLVPPIKSLSFLPKQGFDEESPGNVANLPTLITLRSVMTGDSFEPGNREIYVCCIRTMAANQKKGGEFTVDGAQVLLSKGFTIQPQKGTVEADNKVAIVVSWLPPPSFDPNSIVDATVNIILKSEVTEQITLVIKAMVVSA